MRSIGLDLDRWVKKGLLRIHAARPTLYGLEFHLATMHREVDEAKPSVVVVDPLSSFTGGTFGEVNSMVMRLIDFLKGRNITALFTHLIPGSGASQDIEVGVSSLMDTWILLRNCAARRARRAPPVDPEVARHGALVGAAVVRADRRRRRSSQAAAAGDRGRARGVTGMTKQEARRAPLATNGSCGSTSPARARVRRRRCAISRAICEEHLAGRYRIEVIDLLKHPQLARGDQIVARADARPPPAAADEEDHRRSVERGARPGRPRPAAAAPSRGRPAHDRSAARKKAGAATRRTKAKYLLRLYVTGTTGKSVRAIQNVRRICEEHLKGLYDLEVVDIYKNLPLARGDQIIAAPTLIKRLPAPLRRLIGDMSDEQRVLVGLDHPSATRAGR